MHPPPLTPWERATGVAQAHTPGWCPGCHATRLTWGLALLATLWLWGEWGLFAIFPALLLARLITLDLTSYTLPDIYLWPLLTIGALHALLGGYAGLFFLIALIFALFCWRQRHRPQRWFLGEGDVKLLLAMVGLLGPVGTCAAVFMGAMLWLPVALWRPRVAVPLGVPLLLGWLVVLGQPALPQLLFSPITGG